MGLVHEPCESELSLGDIEALCDFVKVVNELYIFKSASLSYPKGPPYLDVVLEDIGLKSAGLIVS